MGETIRFEINEPRVVALKYSEGKEVQGRFGEQYYYTTVDGNNFYLDQPIGEKLHQLNIRPGEFVQILKKAVRNGRSNGIEWCITRIPAKGNGRSLENSPAPTQPVAPRQTSTEPKTQANGNAEIVHTQTSQVMTGCLIASIDALLTAGRYADAKGLKLQFNEEDVRTVASTLYIQHCRVIEQRMRSTSWQQ